jgi:hypothetical protein
MCAQAGLSPNDNASHGCNPGPYVAGIPSRWESAHSSVVAAVTAMTLAQAVACARCLQCPRSLVTGPGVSPDVPWPSYGRRCETTPIRDCVGEYQARHRSLMCDDRVGLAPGRAGRVSGVVELYVPFVKNMGRLA